MRVLGVALTLIIGCDDGSPTADPPLQLVDRGAVDQGVIDATPDDATVADLGPDMAPDMSPDAGPLFAVDCAAVPAVTVDELDLGTITISTAGTLAQRFTLPDDVIAFTVVMIEAEDRSLLMATHLTDPEGTAWVSPMPEGYRPSNADRLLGPFPGAFHSPNRATVGATGANALLVPNNPAVRVIPGEWQVRFAAVSAATGRGVETTAQIKLLVKRSAGTPTCGRIPLHLFFTGSSGWTAESAPNDARFQQALARMQSFYTGVGITLGPITYDDVEDPPESVDAMGSSQNDLFATNGYGDGLALFFVARITAPFGGGIGGVAGGIPGPTLQPNTARSGVVVATEIDRDPDAIGHIMGHESGHFLGLFHSIEFFGQRDQIDDTPENPGDQSNLMFPTVTAAEARLTPGQGWVLHKNASVIAEVPR